MSLEIQQLLNELYAIDPGLKEHEQEVIAAIKKLQESRPDVPLDDQFIRTLREKLVTSQPKVPFLLRINELFHMKRAPLFMSGAAALSVLVALGAFMTLQNPGGQVNGITLLSAGAFGSLRGEQASISTDGLGGGSAQSAERSSVASGLALAVPAPTSNPVADAKMIAPEYTMYTYRYTGEPITVPESELSVYRRIKEVRDGDDVTRLLSRKDFGMIDIGSFKNLKLQSVNLYQDIDDGYVMTVDLREGNISFYADWNRWFAKDGCSVGPCKWTEPVPLNELASDEEFVRIANAFLKTHGVDTGSYGTPIVDKEWRRYMIMESGSVTSMPAAAPVSISVIYPLVVEGHEISDINGTPFGLRVSVQARKMKVESVWNLTTNRFEKSSYAVEQDGTRIVKVAERGGMYGPWYGATTKTVELELGTPTLVYVMQDHYNQDKQTSDQLYTPAYRFPIMNAPTDGILYQTSITVPLVKELLDEQDAVNPERPVPFISPAVDAAPAALR